MTAPGCPVTSDAADGTTALELYGNELTDGVLNPDDNAPDAFIAAEADLVRRSTE